MNYVHMLNPGKNIVEMNVQLLRQIANYQILYSACCKDLGLLRGKIGISLFFFFIMLIFVEIRFIVTMQMN